MSFDGDYGTPTLIPYFSKGYNEAQIHSSRLGWQQMEVEDTVAGTVTFVPDGGGSVFPSAPYDTTYDASKFPKVVDIVRDPHAFQPSDLAVGYFNILDGPGNRFQQLILFEGQYTTGLTDLVASHEDGDITINEIGSISSYETRLQSHNDGPSPGSFKAYAGTGEYYVGSYANEGDWFGLYAPFITSRTVGSNPGVDNERLAIMEAALDAPIVSPSVTYPDTRVLQVASIARPQDDSPLTFTYHWYPNGVSGDPAPQWRPTAPSNSIGIGSAGDRRVASLVYDGHHDVVLTRTILFTITP